MEPVYLQALRAGDLERIAGIAWSRLSSCMLCPRRCGVDRVSGETGACHTGTHPRVSAHGPHFGEEAPLTGKRGSGTIFFSYCNLRCAYCQNYPISHEGRGDIITCSDLAGVMLGLQERGCHNINLVSPSHVVPQVITAVFEAASAGLRIPIVFNTGGYDDPETLRLLERVVDIYMPDFKYWDEQTGRDLSGIPGYPVVARTAIREMHRQVGDLVLRDGIAVRGLLVRHLVLPGDLSGTADVLHFLAREISRETWVNVMDQYHPVQSPGLTSVIGKDPAYSALARRITDEEYRDAIRLARKYGLHRGLTGQGM